MMKGQKYLDLYYAAYGSNTNLKEMETRCPEAKYEGVGHIEGYELLFCGEPGKSFLNIRPNSAEIVRVCLFKITENDLKSLDEYEEYPKLYDRVNCDVFMNDGSIKQAFFYEMDPKYKTMKPSESYYKRCEQGYIDNHIDTSYLKEALKKSIK